MIDIVDQLRDEGSSQSEREARSEVWGVLSAAEIERLRAELQSIHDYSPEHLGDYWVVSRMRNIAFEALHDIKR